MSKHKKPVFMGSDPRYNGCDIACWIDTLNQSNSRHHKEEVIATALSAAVLGSVDAEAFLYTCHLAYDPFKTFNIKRVPTTADITGTDNPWTEFWSLCSALSRREITGNAALEAVSDISNQFDSEQWNGVCRPALLKDLRVGVSEKTLNRVLGHCDWRIPVFSCQLAQDSEGHTGKLRGKKLLERKLDGSRMLVVFDENGKCTGTFSRNGKEYTNFGHVATALQEVVDRLGGTWWDGIVFDGEVMSDSFQSLMKQARRKTDVDAADTVYHIFDCIPLSDFRNGYCSTPQYQRTEWLTTRASRFEEQGCLKISGGIVVDLDTPEGHDQMERYARESVEQGFEGIMIKSQNAGYHTKRSSDWLKKKPVIDVDLKVVAVEEGTGKNVGKLGALVCEGVDGGRHIRVNVGNGFSDEQRQEFWDDQSLVIDKTVEIRADVVTQNQDGGYSLRFPRFHRFRPEKD